MTEKTSKTTGKTMKKPYEMTQLENLRRDPFGYIFLGCYSKQNLEKQREIDRYSLAQPNQLMQAMYKCKTLTQKIFTLIVQEFLNRKDFSDKPVKLDLINVTKAFTPYTPTRTTGGQKSPLKQMYKESIEELRKLALTYQDENSYHAINLFDEVKFQWEWGTFKFWLSPKFRHMLELGQKHGLTIYNIDTIAPMKSFYAIRFFQIAMSYYGFKGKTHSEQHKQFFKAEKIDIRNTWWFSYSYQELRMLFKIGADEYAGKQGKRMFKLRVIENPISEINSVQSKIQIKVYQLKNGREIIGWTFVCTEKNEPLKISKSDSRKARAEKKAVNSEQEQVEAEIDLYRSKYPDLWAEKYGLVRSRNTLPFGFKLNDEIETLKLVKQELAD